MTKNSFHAILYSLIILTFITSCISGSPLPQQKAIQYLQRAGIEDELIKRLRQREVLSIEEYEFFEKSDNENVRFMIATNPYTPASILCHLANDKSDLVLQGVFRNKHLPLEEINKHLYNSDVLKYIVGNSTVSQQIVLRIYREEKNIPFTYFAINPNCPDEIKKDILNSNDSLAKRWIEINSAISGSDPIEKE